MIESNLIVEVALTGGPCSGKTLGIGLIAEALRGSGVRTLVVPEVATLLYTGGIPDIGGIAGTRRELYEHIESSIALIQWRLRGEYRALAAGFGEQVVILNDRGELDLAAYLEPDEFARALESAGLEREQCLLSYDAVVAFKTSEHAIHFLTNNSGRREASLEEAVAASERTIAAWAGHPALSVIEGDPSFEKRVGEALRAIHTAIGAKSPASV